MDGGGRYLQPMTAYPAGVAVARAASAAEAALRPSRRPPPQELFACRRGVRRRSAGAPLAQRLPRFLGSGLAVGFFRRRHRRRPVAGRPSRRLHPRLRRAASCAGPPRRPRAREGDDLRHRRRCARTRFSRRPGSIRRLSLAVPRRERGARAPRNAFRWSSRASVRKLYPNELVITPHRARAARPLAAQRRTVRHRRRRHGHRPDAGRALRRPALVVGEQAPTRATRNTSRFIEAAGPLKNRIRAGTLVVRAGAGRSRWTTAWTCACRSCGAADALARLVKLEREQKILEKDVLADRSAHGRSGRRPPHGRGGRRPAPRHSRRNQCAARGSTHESLGSRFDAAPEAALRAQERDPVGARCRHEQGRLRRRGTAAGRRGRVAARPHPCGAHPRHRPSAFRRASRAASSSISKRPKSAIRQAVHAAERMAKVEIQSVIVNLTGGRLGSEHFEAHVPVRGAVGAGDVHRVLDAASEPRPAPAAAPSCTLCRPDSRSMRRTTSSTLPA